MKVRVSKAQIAEVLEAGRIITLPDFIELEGEVVEDNPHTTGYKTCSLECIAYHNPNNCPCHKPTEETDKERADRLWEASHPKEKLPKIEEVGVPNYVDPNTATHKLNELIRRENERNGYL